jgi:hypothetical protein
MYIIGYRLSRGRFCYWRTSSITASVTLEINCGETSIPYAIHTVSWKSCDVDRPLDADEDKTRVGRRRCGERMPSLSLKPLKEVKDMRVKLHNAAVCDNWE